MVTRYFSPFQFSKTVAWLALAIPLIVLIGWVFDFPVLRSGLPGFPQMVPMTAMTLMLAASALLLSKRHDDHDGQPSAQQRLVTFLLITLIIILGLLTLVDNLFLLDTDLNLNLNFFFHDTVQGPGVSWGGNMSNQTAISLTLLALSLLISNYAENKYARWIFQLMPLVTVAVCLLAIVGYIYDVRSFTASNRLIGLSVPNSITQILLAAGILNLRPKEGLVRELLSSGSSGLFLRRFAFLSVCAPILLGLVISWGEAAGHYPSAYSQTLFAVLMILILSLLGILMAIAIRRSEEQQLGIEKRRSQAVLRESEENLNDTKERLEFALKTSNMGTWQIELQTGSTFWSETTRKLLGFGDSQQNASLPMLENVIHPEDLSRFFTARQIAIQNRSLFEIDFRVVWSDQSIRWLRCRARATYASDGTPLVLGGTVLDVTAEKTYQRSIEEALQAAESANRLKSTFLANMSHEIRTPLGAILGFADLMNDTQLNEEERGEYLKIIIRNGETLSRLINDILDLSKVEAGYLEVENMSFSLLSLAQETLSLLEVRVAERKLDLHLKIEENVPDRIVSDPTRLKQILFNLIGNAIKFTSAGSVTLRISNLPEDVIAFDVIDTGIGIEPSLQGKLFEPFTQADGSVSRKYGGTGLGLGLSRKLAQLLGGTIELSFSNMGAGSQFRATIKDRSREPWRGIEKS